jgi:excisionase family DNA binding protein
MQIVEGKIYKTSEILEILQMSRPTLYNAIRDGKIKSIGVRQVRIIGKELQRFLEG